MEYIWIHGWGSTKAIWTDLLRKLPQDKHRFASFKSIKSLTDVSNILDPFIKASDRLTVVGWSLGGMIAINAAARYPETIKALILINTTVRFTDTDRRLGWPERVVNRMKRRLRTNRNKVINTFFNSMLTERELDAPTGSINDTNLRLDRITENPDFTDRGLELGLDYLIQTDLSSSVKTLSMPILWLHGSADTICPIERFRNTRRQLSHRANINFVEAENYGHLTPLYKTSITATTIREFADGTINR